MTIDVNTPNFRPNKPIRTRMEMTREEYIEEMKRSTKQVGFAKSIGYDAERVPRDMECYHGNLLRTCQSYNCEVDSGRV